MSVTAVDYRWETIERDFCSRICGYIAFLGLMRNIKQAYIGHVEYRPSIFAVYTQTHMMVSLHTTGAYA